MALQNLRSNTANKRPTASGMVDGQVAINTNATNPGLFFKDAGDGIRKVGPVFIGSSAPNSSPAVGGSTGHSIGEQWLDTSGSRYVVKTWDGTAWRDDDSNYLQLTGGALSGALTIDNAANVAALDLKFDGDTDTGFYSPSANTLGVATGGIERLRFDSSGRVGIGTTSPDRVLEIQNASPIIRLTESAGTYSEISASTSILSFRADEGNGAANTRMDFRLNGSEKMRIDSSGRLGLGTSSPSYQFHVSNSSASGLGVFTRTSGASTYIEGAASSGTLGTVGSHPLNFTTNSTTAITIDTSQNVGVGTTSPDQKLHIVGNYKGVNSSGQGVQIVNAATPYIQSLGTSTINDLMVSSKTFRVETGTSYATSERLRIDSSGRVGIGTSTLTGNSGSLSILKDSSLYWRKPNGQIKGDILVDDSENIIFNHGASSTEVARIDSSGRLLLGTTTAGDANADGLTIHKSSNTGITIRTGDSNNGNIFFDDSSGVARGSIEYNHSSDLFKFNTAGTGRLYIDSSGRVGIGTSAPSNLLHLNHSSDAAIRFDRGGTKQLNIGTDSSQSFIASFESKPLAFATSTSSAFTERMRIDSSGRLLVGTTSAVDTSDEAIVHVVDTLGARLVLGRNDTSVAAGNGLGGIRFAGNDTTSNTFTTLGEITCQADGTHAAGDNPTRLTFKTTAGGSSSVTERMRIDSSGRVGIGTTSPGRQLQINGDSDTQIRVVASAGGSAGIQFGDANDSVMGGVNFDASDDSLQLRGFNNSERMRIDSSGNVGVGTTTPDRLLQLSASGAAIRITDTDGGGNFDIRNENGEGIIETRSGHALVFKTSQTEAYRVTYDGKVGIGTSSPSTSLEVVGNTTPQLKVGMANDADRASLMHNGSNLYLDTTAGALIFRGASNAERMRIDSSGNVGIGTSSPGAKLDVNGGLRLATGNTISTTSSGGTVQIQGGATFPGGNILLGGGSGNDDIRFRTSGASSTSTERMRIDSSGNVGIGTTAPNSLLEIRGTSDGQNVLHLSNTAGSSDGDAENQLRVTCNGNTNWGNLDIQAYQTIFSQNGSERMRIDNSGRLLVGTSSEIVSGSASSSLHMVDGGGGKIYMMRDDSGSTVAGNDLGMIRFYSNDGTAQESARIEAEADLDHGTNDKPGRLVFSTTADGASSPT